jgi:transposase
METREQRGLQIAAVSKLTPKGSVWLVPSQTGNGDRYTVDPDGQWCTCFDHEVRQVKCKHIWAVEFVMRREVAPDGTETLTQTMRVTYKQNWAQYNAAQTSEKGHFMRLLAELCDGVESPRQTSGRPRLPLGDMAFAAAFKVYTGFSSRRFTSDLHDAHKDGLIGSAPHFNSVTNYLSSPALTPVLTALIEQASLPLRVVETDFAVDSTGFATSRFVRWYNKKWGRVLDNQEWVKAHIMCGVRTHTVTGVEVSDWKANDAPFLPKLVESTAGRFDVREVSADKAYSGRPQLQAIESVGATSYVPFKRNVVAMPEGTSIWARAYHLFAYNREKFLEHYHKRSNVETVFSMIKGKFGDSVRSKTDVGQVNEVLAKVLCHNICVLIQAMYEFGIDPTFCAENAPAQEMVG